MNRAMLLRCLLSALALAVVACGGSDDEPAEAGPPGADPLTTPQADEFLAQHNLVRANVQPAPTTPLPALTWSAQAASVAQAWAKECSYRHNSGHSFGENIAANTPPGSFTPAGITDAWASEVADYDYASNTCSNVCGHYTQIVWADTLRLGCGKATCPAETSPFQDGRSWDFWVCNYDPAGNVIGEWPY